MSVASEIRVQGRTFVLKSPLRIDVSYDEDGAFASHGSLPVSGYGNTLGKALDAFYDMFEVQWDELVACNEDELAPSGKRGRDLLRAAVSTVRDDP